MTPIFNLSIAMPSCYGSAVIGGDDGRSRERVRTSRHRARHSRRWPAGQRWPGGHQLGSRPIHCARRRPVGRNDHQNAMTHLARWNAGTALGEHTRRRVLASSAVGVISVPGSTLTGYAHGGSAVEAVWITAQQHGLVVQPISPVFFYGRDVDELTELSTPFADERGKLQQEFRQLVRTPAGNVPVLVLLTGPRELVHGERESFISSIELVLCDEGECRTIPRPRPDRGW